MGATELSIVLRFEDYTNKRQAHTKELPSDVLGKEWQKSIPSGR